MSSNIVTVKEGVLSTVDRSLGKPRLYSVKQLNSFSSSNSNEAVEVGIHEQREAHYNIEVPVRQTSKTVYHHVQGGRTRFGPALPSEQKRVGVVELGFDGNGGSLRFAQPQARIMQFAKDFWNRFSGRGRFQILSDLHLEVGQQYNTYRIPPHAPYLILAGDIGRLVDYEGYLAFLTHHVSQFQLIFLVLGNHEFYGLTLEGGLETAAKLESEEALSSKLILMHRRRHDILELGVIVLGCTLWSAIPKEAEEIVTAKITDFKRIIKWDVQHHNIAHQLDVEWLSAQINTVKEQTKNHTPRRIIVVTHHAPCIEGTSNPVHTGSDCNSAFATDLLRNDCWSGVNYWVFGHTHYSTTFEQDGIRLIANQRGYVLNPNDESTLREKQVKKHKFDVKKVIMV